MDFEFSDEQRELAALARELFERESPPSRLRELWSSGEPRDTKVWRTMAEAGFTGVTVPDAAGGMGGDEVDLVLVLEEAGRAALPEPIVETVAVAAPVLATRGAGEWPARIASGEAIVTLQLGDAPFAVDADVADLLLFERDGRLHAVPRDRYDVRRIASEDGARRLFEVQAPTDASTELDADPHDAFLRAAAATAAVLNGVAMRMLDMTVEHVKHRTQFDRPVGSFQAVKHKLASAYVAVESSRAAAWYAAYAIATDDPGRERATMIAKAAASDAERLANTEALQCHGGIGFTWEHDLHLWLKRGNALRPAYGSAAEHRAALAKDVFAE